TYPSWEAMDKAAERNSELEKLAWPDENARNAFFKKLDDNFSVKHSDEIYAPIDGAMLLPQDNNKDLVMYVRKTYFTFPEDGSEKEFKEMHAENVAKVRSEEHTSELQSRENLVCRLLLEKKKNITTSSHRKCDDTQVQ